MRKKCFEDLPEPIRGFSNLMKGHIASGKTCYACPLFGSGPVILDTNLPYPAPVHLAIIGLNPGGRELETGVPFVGGAGRILHKYFDPIISKYNLSYVIYNVILCYTPNEKSISDFKKTSLCCKPLFDTITQYFPSTIKVVLGEKARTALGAGGGKITKVNGQMINNHFVMLHPSVLQYTPSHTLLFEEAIVRLERLILRTFDFKGRSL